MIEDKLSKKQRKLRNETQYLEKDFNRLMHHPEIGILKEYPVHYLPMEMAFGEEDSKLFEQKILDYAGKNQ